MTELDRESAVFERLKERAKRRDKVEDRGGGLLAWAISKTTRVFIFKGSGRFWIVPEYVWGYGVANAISKAMGVTEAHARAFIESRIMGESN